MKYSSFKTILIVYHIVAGLGLVAAEYGLRGGNISIQQDNTYGDVQQHRILTNIKRGTVTYPLISHKLHLDRLRRKLHEIQHGSDLDTKLPFRPRISRHSYDNHSNRSRGQQMVALYQGYGTHYVDIWVGTPPQRQTVIVDTGSGVTAFPCEECKGCGDGHQINSNYQQSLSKTFRPLDCNECFRPGSCMKMNETDKNKRCRVHMSYAEGSSWRAYEAMDVCYAGDAHDVASLGHMNHNETSPFAFELAFGCQVLSCT